MVRLAVKWNWLLSFVFLFFFSAGSGAIPAKASEFPHPVGSINDFASIVDSNTTYTLVSALRLFNKQTGIQIAVVTVKSTGDLGIDEYANKLFQTWGIGVKGLDNGVMLIAAMKERKIRIEVGYGLEPGLTDEQAGSIIRDDIVPAFKSGHYSRGIYNGTMAIIKTLKQSMKRGLISPHTTSPRLLSIHIQDFGNTDTFNSVLGILFFMAVIILPIYFELKTRRIIRRLLRSGGFGTGFGGRFGGGFGGGAGGFGGFGGGLSGGGGASFHW